jgi:hypothetical protein
MISLDLHLSKHTTYWLVGVSFCVCLFSWIIQTICSRGSRSTPLRGPPSKSLLFGLGSDISTSPDSSTLYQEWAKEYGSAYRIPHALWSSRVVLIDPKAVAAFFTRETFVYVRSSDAKRTLERLVSLTVFRQVPLPFSE